MFEQVSSFLEIYFWAVPLFIFLFFVVRYFLLSIVPYWLLWKAFPEQLKNRKIQEAPIAPGQVRKEVVTSLQSFAAMALVATFFLWGYLKSHSKIYLDWNDYPLGWVLISIPLSFVIHDVYFYWSHRLLHQAYFFRKIHWVHHQFHNPTPCASHSFHWIEAVLQVLFAGIIIFFVPMHPITFLVFMAVTHFFTTWGHFGYELMPFAVWKSKWGFWITTSTHHNFHHRYVHQNYALYLKFWDRLFGTLNNKTGEFFDSKTKN